MGQPQPKRKKSLLAASAQGEPEMWEKRPLWTVWAPPFGLLEKGYDGCTPGLTGAFSGSHSVRTALRRERLERSHRREKSEPQVDETKRSRRKCKGGKSVGYSGRTASRLEQCDTYGHCEAMSR
jgi:hypothetical protein